VALAIAVPAVLVVQLVDALSDDDGMPGSAVPFALVVLAGMGVGGWALGRSHPRAPVGSGALVALVAIAIVQAIGVVRLTVTDEDVAWGAIPVTTALAAALGAAGTALARRQAARTRP
jgi:hypothetical protein